MLLHGQTWQWANGAGGASYDYGQRVVVDSMGNSYTTGIFEQQMLIGTTQLLSAGSSDIFIAKHDPLGKLLWAVRAGGTNFDNPTDITIDRKGNIYLTGYFRGNTIIGGQTLTSRGGQDVFIAKYNPSGGGIWVRQAGGRGNDYGIGIRLDTAEAYLFVGGGFDSTAHFSTDSITTAGKSDIFLARYSVDGDFQWVRRGGGREADNANGIDVDRRDNCYITGSFSDTVSFGNQSTNSSGPADIDLFIAKYNYAGIPQWVSRGGGKGPDYPAGIATDRDGDCYIVGQIADTASFGDSVVVTAGLADILVVKCSQFGTFRWARRMGGASNDQGRNLAVDHQGNIFAVGNYRATATFGDTTLTSEGVEDIFVAKLTSTGNIEWARTAGGQGRDDAFGIDADMKNNYYVTGLHGRIRFGSITIPTTGDADIFLAKLGPSPAITTGTITETSFCSGVTIPVRYTTVGTFAVGNVFTAQLSDSTGSFAAPTNIGSAPSIGDGVIAATIPLATPSGSGYRIRVVSSTPATVGTANAVDIRIFGPFTPQITPSDTTTFCQGGSVVLDAGPGFASYLWSTGASTRTITVSQSGEYTVTTTNAAGCSGVSTTTRVTVHPAPVRPTIVRNGNELVSSEAYSYQWSLNGQPIDRATRREYRPLESGTYTVMTWDANGCTAVSDLFQFSTVGVDEPGAAGALTIFPDPTTGVFTIEGAIRGAGAVRLAIVDAQGRVVLEREEQASGLYRARVDIEHLPVGAYFVRVTCGEETWSRKIIKR